MKHGVAFRKFSRTTSHRMLMLRNLVTSLFEHGRIKTTLPKARDTARLAEKMITLGKRGDLPSHRRASAFLLKPAVVPKVFTTFAERYSQRPGGYTRIHKYGNRPGDNAPVALLELVDSPHDVRFAMTARAVGRETLALKLADVPLRTALGEGVSEVAAVVEKERAVPVDQTGLLNATTRANLKKVLRYREPGAVAQLVKQAKEHADQLLARPANALGYINDRAPTALRTSPKTRERLDSVNGTAHELFTGRSVAGTRGALPVSQLRERGDDVMRRLQGPFIKPKKVPYWAKGAKPKLGIALSSP